jgi:putative membrane protein (TIGR04086 family)
MESKNIISGIKKASKGFAAGMLLAAAGILLSGLFLMLTEMKMETSQIIIMIFITAGAFINAFMFSSAVGRRGLLTGLCAGFIYLASILICFALILGSRDAITFRLVLFTAPLAVSAAAGILGVSRS